MNNIGQSSRRRLTWLGLFNNISVSLLIGLVLNITISACCIWSFDKFHRDYSFALAIKSSGSIWHVKVEKTLISEQVFWNRYDTLSMSKWPESIEARKQIVEDMIGKSPNLPNSNGFYGFRTTQIPKWSRYDTILHRWTFNSQSPGVVEWRVGWPLGWMWFANELGGPVTAADAPSYNVSTSNSKVMQLPRWIPDGILQVPFMLNVVILAFLFSTLLYCVGVLRKVADFRKGLRISRRQCVACGYSIVGLNGAVCPECGNDVFSQQTSAEKNCAAQCPS